LGGDIGMSWSLSQNLPFPYAFSENPILDIFLSGHSFPERKLGDDIVELFVFFSSPF